MGHRGKDARIQPVPPEAGGSPADGSGADGEHVAVDEPAVDRAVPTLAPLAVPAYRRMWGAAVVSHLGTFLQLTAAPWIMLELTGSAFLVSLVTTFLLLPRLLLTLPAGALADVVDRRTLLILGNVIGALAVGTMAALEVAGGLGATAILLLTLALGSGSAIAMPSFQTMVPDLVPRSLLPQAITLNSGAFNVARAVGPAIGGAMIAAGLVGLAFGLNAASFLVVIAVLLTLPRDEIEDVVTSPRRVVRATVTGVRFARFAPDIRNLLVITGVFAVTAASVQALLAPAAVELGLGGTGFGVLWGAFGVGALAGIGSRERSRILLGRRMIPVSMALFGLGGIVFGLAPGPAVAGLGLLLAGLAWTWVLITLNATVQLLAPTWVRSRVVSIYALVVGLQPIGALLAGLLAERTGSGNAIAISTALTLVGALAAARQSLPVLGRITEPQPAGLEVLDELRAVDVTGPVMVIRTWCVDEADIEEFLDTIRAARHIRRRTGASGWELNRDAIQLTIFTEVVRYPNWEEHLLQRTRLDTDDLEVLRHLRFLDIDGAPRTRLLTPFDP